jgi:hypothetical protein
MKARQIWAGRVPPVMFLPKGLLSSRPIQTPVTPEFVNGGMDLGRSTAA